MVIHEFSYDGNGPWALSWGFSVILSSVHWQSVRSSSTRLLWNSRFCFHSRSVYGLHHLGAGSRVLFRALGEVVFRALLLLKHHKHSRWAIVRKQIKNDLERGVTITEKLFFYVFPAWCIDWCIVAYDITIHKWQCNWMRCRPKILIWQIWVYYSGSLFQWQPFSIFNTRHREGPL